MPDEPGRSCPLHYRYAPAALAGAPRLLEAETAYIVGGLYGNLEALAVLEARASAERAALVFNGDAHWFDAEPAWFAEVQRRVLAHPALAGNVEAELAEASGAGCGCAYPEWVDDATVARSNAVMTRLRAAVPPPLQAALARLPRYGRARIAGLEVLLLHGDDTSLAGWGLAVEAFEREPEAAVARLARALGASGADVVAATHTCLPHARLLTLHGRRRALFNNGSAGMPNLAGDRRGLVTRIACRPAADALWRVSLGDAVVEAVPVAYDAGAWWARFSALWPPGSAAAAGYARRLRAGPDFTARRAVGPGITGFRED